MRLITASLLRKRSALSVEAAERLLADSNAKLRFEALQNLAANGKSFSLADAKAILIKPVGPLSTDYDGQTCFREWQEEHFKAMPLADLALASHAVARAIAKD